MQHLKLIMSTVLAVCSVALSYPSSDGDFITTMNLGSVDMKAIVPGVVNVELALNLVGVTELNEDQGYIEFTGWLTMMWNDSRLSLPGGESTSFKVFHVDANDIWTPDIQLYNAVSTGYQILNRDRKAVVLPGGGVILVDMFTSRSLCDVRGALEARASVICELKFGSWTYSGLQVNLLQSNFTEGSESTNASHDLDLSEFQATGKWTVTAGHQHRLVKVYPCCSEPYPSVIYTVSLQERATGASL